MRRRESPYSRLEEIRRSRGELLALVLTTVTLGTLLSLLTNGLYDYLLISLSARQQFWAFGLAVAVTLALVMVLVWLFYARGESQRATIEFQIPYHIPASGRATIAQRRSYQVTVHARRAFNRRYRQDSEEQKELVAAWQSARAEETSFQKFIAEANAELVQCLALYVLHCYGEKSLGPEAAYSWWSVEMPARKLKMDDLPTPLRDNPFLRADQRAEEWTLLLPQDVQLELLPEKGLFPRWRLCHRHYGYVELRWHPRLSIFDEESQAYRILTQRLRLSSRSQLYVVGTRLEAVACFRWTFWPASDSFHDWATGLLARLEEALDWDYFLATRADRLVADLDWKVGWVPEGTSLVEMLQSIEGRLEELEGWAAKEEIDRGLTMADEEW
jgi:hypothetical protein